MDRPVKLLAVMISAFAAAGAIVVAVNIGTPTRGVESRLNVHMKPSIQQPQQPVQQPPQVPRIKHLEYGAKVYTLSYDQIGTTTWPKAETELLLLKNMGIRFYSIRLNHGPRIKDQKDKIAIIDQAVS